MPNQLVECIPNFSDARRPEVIQKILDSIQSVSGVHVLDQHSDIDHNRTVVTFIGEPAAVEEAAYQSIKTAALLINLDEHRGEHPRLGATDVVPFVPISEISMQDCIEMARRLGKRVGEALKIPVFLYEEAATIPEKQNLENIRRGQYEALKEEIGSSPVRTPDFGPNTCGQAGATVIGARQPLIAFNIYLMTNDVTVAQKISKAVRNSSGGLRYVKGMGVLVDGRAQVSMNLTNFKKTPIARVVEFVRREAERYGTGIHHSELVGLIPQDALVDAAQWYTQLDTFEPAQILEQRLMQEMRSNSGLAEKPSDFLEELASANPTPGGGSAAAHTAAEGAALVTMVARLTTGRKKYADVQDQMWKLIEDSEKLRSELTAAISEDSSAFVKVMETYKLPKNSEDEIELREKAIQDAMAVAATVPLKVAKNALKVMKCAFEAASYGNVNAISDAASGLFFAKAGLISACINVRTNVINLKDALLCQELMKEVRTIETQAQELDNQVWQVLKERGGLPVE
jgi:glutamate formiminotransferase/formiminotetrahydrofolate cyclodeaminase